MIDRLRLILRYDVFKMLFSDHKKYLTFRTDKVRPSKEYNNSRKTESRTCGRWNSELPKELATC